jgi:mRNA (guanine-N7-)-methyltransferase
MRQESPIIGLKNFNNWIKSVLFANFGHSVLASSPYSQSRPQDGRRGGPVGRGKVLDMGCGKGGDLNKWAKARIKEYVGLGTYHPFLPLSVHLVTTNADIAGVSVEQARQRHGTLRGPRFEATFAACDCYNVSIASVLDPEKLTVPFDVVSLQFCMHYAFETEDKARCMLGNVSNWLRVGGIFVGTIPNAAQLM